MFLLGDNKNLIYDYTMILESIIICGLVFLAITFCVIIWKRAKKNDDPGIYIR